MENSAFNLQDKIQKLIDQYTKDKKKLEELESMNAALTEENLQLIQQIEENNQLSQNSGNLVKELEEKLAATEKKYQDLKSMLDSFENLAGTAIEQIDALVEPITKP